MYRITHFDKKLCHLLGRRLDLADDNVCEFYSIWNFCPRSRWKALKAFYSGKHICRAQYFPIIYWLVLLSSVVGTVHSFCEFTSLFWGSRKHVTMWRQRTFYVLPPSVQRKFRLVGALITLNAWLLLSYALVKVSPTHMTPWISMNMLVLGSDLIILIAEVLLGACKLQLCTVCSFMLALANCMFVNCVHNVFTTAIELNEADELKLWKSV